MDDDNDEDMSDNSDADYAPSRSLLRRNVAGSGDERMSDRSAEENTGGLSAMEDELESGI